MNIAIFLSAVHSGMIEQVQHFFFSLLSMVGRGGGGGGEVLVA